MQRILPELSEKKDRKEGVKFMDGEKKRWSNGIKIDTDKLIYICINKGITRQELTEKSGVASSTILASRKRPIKPETVMKIVQALGIKVEEII